MFLGELLIIGVLQNDKNQFSFWLFWWSFDQLRRLFSSLQLGFDLLKLGLNCLQKNQRGKKIKYWHSTLWVLFGGLVLLTNFDSHLQTLATWNFNFLFYGQGVFGIWGLNCFNWSYSPSSFGDNREKWCHATFTKFRCLHCGRDRGDSIRHQPAGGDGGGMPCTAGNGSPRPSIPTPNNRPTGTGWLWGRILWGPMHQS